MANNFHFSGRCPQCGASVNMSIMSRGENKNITRWRGKCTNGHVISLQAETQDAELPTIPNLCIYADVREWPGPQDPALKEQIPTLQVDFVGNLGYAIACGHEIVSVEIIDKPADPDSDDPWVRERSTYGWKMNSLTAQ